MLDRKLTSRFRENDIDRLQSRKRTTMQRLWTYLNQRYDLDPAAHVDEHDD